jgi:AcrR family transcriptional regulator
MSPRPQIDHIRRPQMLAAAAEVIAERGLVATRIADVAERAGSSPAAVLYWFPSKEELLLAALIDDEERFYATVLERLAPLDQPGEKLAAIFASCAAESQWPLWVELWSLALREEGAASARERFDERWRSLLADVISEGQEQGEFSGGDPRAAATALSALIDGLAVQITLGDENVTPASMIAVCARAAEALLQCDLSGALAAGEVAL